MGMDKSGDFYFENFPWTKVPGWTVRSGYPNTVITSDGIVVSGSGAVTIRFRVIRVSSTGLSDIPTRIMVNGVVLGAVEYFDNDTTEKTRNTTLNNGDVITMEVEDTGSSIDTYNTLTTGTYLIVEPV
ncbi:hypothetical protein [Rhodococcus opacus]|uniref:hypothetical protein n=1 Tax=Rhodococcus opacus TaxID=37919 RepID=UPI0011D11C42|nr:hypothetical protein [Rhodococcus opacus]